MFFCELPKKYLRVNCRKLKTDFSSRTVMHTDFFHPKKTNQIKRSPAVSRNKTLPIMVYQSVAGLRCRAVPPVVNGELADA